MKIFKYLNCNHENQNGAREKNQKLYVSHNGFKNHFKLSIFTKHRNGLWCGYKKMLFGSDLSLSFLLGLKVAMQTKYS